jgi:hypothetical protein
MMKELIERFKSKTPLFFKKIRAIGLYLTTVSAALLVTPDYIHLPEIVSKIAGYVATAGFVMSTVATFAKVDSPQA